jgi:23S rRNA (uridine2552-2'-O)-methyltransferase
MAAYDKSDFWALKAQKEGYPARSVYKLKELTEKFPLLPAGRTGFRVLDLGAAPGSWSLFLLREFRARWKPRLVRGDLVRGDLVRGDPAGTAATDRTVPPEAAPPLLAAADLSPLSRQYDGGLFDGENFFFLQGDFTAPENRAKLIEKGPYHLILSDAAPATTGNRGVDTLRSLALAEEALSYAEAALAAGGHLVVKVFQGGDTAELLKRIRGLFRAGKSCKPQACRSESFETYYLGLEKR